MLSKRLAPLDICKNARAETKEMKVVKFGGSSLANAEQFKKVGDIIRSDKSRRYVIPSAPGKRFSSDTKVTDLLYRMDEKAETARTLRRYWTRSRSALPRSLKVWS